MRCDVCPALAIKQHSAWRFTCSNVTGTVAGSCQLSRVLARAMDEVGHCSDCRTLCETELCALCASGSRDPELLCVVETPVDVDAIEQATNFRGRYFVLMGHLSPLDGIGPEQPVSSRK